MITYRVGYINEESKWVDKFNIRLKDTFTIVSFIILCNRVCELP